MNNGRATQPDVLNARAEAAQATFDLESADGDEKIARVTLTEAVGADPSPNILIDGQKDTPLPQTLTLSIDALIDRAMRNRPDLQAQAAEIRAADDAIRQAKAAYRPQIGLTASAAQTSVWPTTTIPMTITWVRMVEKLLAAVNREGLTRTPNSTPSKSTTNGTTVG